MKKPGLEEQINAQLRALTDEVRALRTELIESLEHRPTGRPEDRKPSDSPHRLHAPSSRNRSGPGG